MTTASDVNSVLDVTNKLLNPKMKKFIKKSMPNVYELLSSKFLDTGKGSLKLKNKKKKKKSNKKKGGSPFPSLFGSKHSKTVDDVGKKINANETLTKHDATILCTATDDLAAQTLITIILSNEDIPGAKDVLKIYDKFLKAQEKVLAVVEEKSKEDKALVKAELEELEQSNMDKRVKEQAITIFENTTSQLGTVQKMVSTHAKNLENVKKRNDIIKTAAFFWFALMAMITIWCFMQFMYNVTSAMDTAQAWLSSFQYVCTSGPSFFERWEVAERDCKEGIAVPIIGGIFNILSDGITTMALGAGEAVSWGKLILIVCAVLQFTAGPLSAGLIGYYGIMSRVREDDREEMRAFKESVETQKVLMDQQQKALKNSKITVRKLADFVGTKSHNPMTTPTIIKMKSTGSKKSRGLSALKDASIEEMSSNDPIEEEGAFRKTGRRSKRRSMRARARARLSSKRVRRPRRTRRTRRPSRRRY